MSQGGTLNDGSLSPDVATSYVTDSGTAIPAANIINILGAGGITTSASGDTILIDDSSSLFTWQVVTSADNPVTLANGNGYIAKGGTAVQFDLPATASVGDTFSIVGYGNLWTITQAASQSITEGNVASTIGVGGSLTATKITDCVDILCVTLNNEFYVISSQGNPNFV